MDGEGIVALHNVLQGVAARQQQQQQQVSDAALDGWCPSTRRHVSGMCSQGQSGQHICIW
jgi:hypothetical protein